MQAVSYQTAGESLSPQRAQKMVEVDDTVARRRETAIGEAVLGMGKLNAISQQMNRSLDLHLDRKSVV